MASLDSFIAEVKTGGLARDNKFLVLITPPLSLFPDTPKDKLRLFCQSASLPGITFMSNPVLTFGEQREVIYNRQFEPINLEFLLDQKMEIKRYFDTWQNYIVNPISRVVNYYERYIGTVEIYQLDGSEQENYKYGIRLYEAFPKIVSNVTYSAASRDVAKINISIEYKYWLPIDVPGNSAETFDVPDRSFTVGNASQGLSNIAGDIIDNFDFPLGEIEI